MINIIVPIIEKASEFEDFVRQNANGEIKFFVGIRESLAKDFKIEAKNLTVLKFADKSKREEIINSLHSCKLSKGKVLIVRRPLNNEEFSSLISSEKEIAVLKPKQNNFVLKFKKMMSSIIRKIFGFSYFDDISAVCFNETMFELLSVCTNLSMASRINRYIGVEIEEVETLNKGVKKERNRFKNALRFSLYTLFWLASIASVVLISIFTPIIIVVIMFEILWLIVATTLWILSLLNFSRALTVGDLHFGRAEEKDN